MTNLMEKVTDYFNGTDISAEGLHDKLSEFLAVEKGGLELYDAALKLVSDPEVINQFKTFRQQTRDHQRILIRVMEALGLDPSYQSPGAELATQKAEGLLKTMTAHGLSAAAAETNAIENIILAETKDHADWEILGKVARRALDPHLRATLESAVSEVEPQEDQHRNWSKEQLGRLELTALLEKRPSAEKTPPASANGSHRRAKPRHAVKVAKPARASVNKKRSARKAKPHEGNARNSRS